MTKPLYQVIASTLTAYQNCVAANEQPHPWTQKHNDKICELVNTHLPSGSGFDAGTTFSWNQSKPNRLVFNTSYHHMNDGGMYDGWSEHKIIVTPHLIFGFNLRITGRDRNDVKDYISEIFQHCLSIKIDEEA